MNNVKPHTIKHRATRKLYYERNKEKIKKASADRYWRYKDIDKPKRQAYYQNNKEKWVYCPQRGRRSKLKQLFGMSETDYLLLLNAQQGVCKICGKPESSKSSTKASPKHLAVDHDHSTGKVRGLLCHMCNVGIGYFQDKVELLDKAKEYLSAGN